MIATIIGALTSRIAGPAAAVAAVILAGVAVGQCSEKNAEGRRADKAESARDLAQANLSTCQNNTRGLKTELGKQTAAVKKLSEEGSRRLTAAEKAVADAERGRAASQARIDRLLKQPPVGIDACARMESADNNVMGALK